MASESLPAKADVVIIGSGIVGCSTAYFLAKRGVDVVVVEKGSLTNEQSSRNWGWLRQQGRNALRVDRGRKQDREVGTASARQGSRGSLLDGRGAVATR